MNEARKVYEAPTLAVVGTFETITQAASNGNATDATFPNNTPFAQLTFS